MFWAQEKGFFKIWFETAKTGGCFFYKYFWWIIVAKLATSFWHESVVSLTMGRKSSVSELTEIGLIKFISLIVGSIFLFFLIYSIVKVSRSSVPLLGRIVFKFVVLVPLIFFVFLSVQYFSIIINGNVLIKLSSLYISRTGLSVVATLVRIITDIIMGIPMAFFYIFLHQVICQEAYIFNFKIIVKVFLNSIGHIFLIVAVSSVLTYLLRILSVSFVGYPIYKILCSLSAIFIIIIQQAAYNTIYLRDKQKA
jgi:hypothetical protein